LEETVAEAVNRRLSLHASLEAEAAKRSRQLVRAEWTRCAEFDEQYREILDGSLPKPSGGLVLSGQFDELRKKSVELRLNVFDWLTWGKGHEEENYTRVTLDATGNLTAERGLIVTRTRLRNNEVAFVRWVFQERSAAREEGAYVWSFEQDEPSSLRDLRKILRAALVSGSLPRFDLPHDLPGRLPIRVVWISRLSEQGFGLIRRAPARALWKALVQAQELAEPDRYRRGSYWRDWIESEAVRRVIEENPVQAHLTSRYPIAGRSEFERRQVVTTYLKTKKLIRVFSAWRKGDSEEVLDAVKTEIGLPLFLIFELLCPASEKESLVVLEGSIQRAWGNRELLQDIVSLD
jgi:hypothetical protein